MASHDAPFERLPNEILISVLSQLSTQEILPLAPFNRRIYSLVTRVLHHRLVQTAPLPDNKLILECYHPSDQLYTPYLACNYQDTVVRDGPPVSDDAPKLADLRRLYASFKPVFAEENRRPRRIRARFTQAPLPEDADDDAATQDIHLDDGELFSQLCAVANLVKEGPKRGLFISHVNIVDGVIRVFRNWLAEGASKQDSSSSGSENIVWVGHHNNVGIRFRVVPAASETMPLISGPDDDPPVHYTLVYEELLVRASNLLQAVERSAVQEVANSGKTLVIHGAAF
ncbi:f-box containing [Fusarium albosuccineum]|uniref:F-box containing n=1 Tax=Fusarium albosuccineum TaxID=1237068 RepID=A0A8H4PCW2_9HYPO|nr:f-box containing [Fusarium albosuccineum]